MTGCPPLLCRYPFFTPLVSSTYYTPPSPFHGSASASGFHSSRPTPPWCYASTSSNSPLPHPTIQLPTSPSPPSNSLPPLPTHPFNYCKVPQSKVEVIAPVIMQSVTQSMCTCSAHRKICLAKLLNNT